MELAHPDSIRALMAPTRIARIARHGRRPQEPLGPGRYERTKNCTCGSCRQCMDNARWEKIFAEKFADPYYYSRLVMRTASPLSSV